MIKYELNGETISIAPIDEEQFKLDNPEAKKIEPNHVYSKPEENPKEVEIDQKEDSTKIETSQEVDPPQNNQQPLIEETKPNIFEYQGDESEYYSHIYDFHHPIKTEEQQLTTEKEDKDDSKKSEEATYPWSNVERTPGRGITDVMESSMWEAEKKKYEEGFKPEDINTPVIISYNNKDDFEEKYKTVQSDISSAENLQVIPDQIGGDGGYIIRSFDAERINKEIAKYDYKEWDAMTEDDKNENVLGWSELNYGQKEKWENHYEVNRPIEIEHHVSDGKVAEEGYFSEPVMLGNYDLGQKDLWHKKWSHKRTFFKQLFDPIAGYGLDNNYLVTVHGGGKKNVFESFGIDLGKQSKYGQKPWSSENYEAIVITHKPTNKKHVIYESDVDEHRDYTTQIKDGESVLTYSGAKKYGEDLNNFLNETLSEDDKTKLNKHVDGLIDFHVHKMSNKVDVGEWGRKSIELEAITLDIPHSEGGGKGVVDVDKAGAGKGYKYIDGVEGGFHMEEVLLYNYIDAWGKKEKSIAYVPGEHYKYNLMAEESTIEYINEGNGYDTAQELRDELFGYQWKGNYPSYTTAQHGWTSDKFDKWGLLTDTQKEQLIAEFEPGKPILNPRYRKLDEKIIKSSDGKEVKTGETFEQRLKEIFIEKRIEEEEEENLSKYLESISTGTGVEAAKLQIGSSAFNQRQITDIAQGYETLKNELEDPEFKKREEDFKALHDQITSQETKDVDPNKQMEIIANEIYSNNGVVLEQSTHDNNINNFLKNNPIVINGETFDFGEEGYNTGRKSIEEKYTFPTMEEFKKQEKEFIDKIDSKTKELQDLYNNGKISFEKANDQLNSYTNEVNKEFDAYKNDLISNENAYVEEVENFNKEFQKQTDDILKIIDGYEKDQERRREKANKEIENYQEENVVLSNGVVISKLEFEKYQKLQNELKKDYEYFEEIESHVEKKIEELDDQLVKDYLIQKNWNWWDKALFNIEETAFNMFGGTSYAIVKIAGGISSTLSGTTEVPEWSKRADVNFNEFKKSYATIRETFKPDVSFDELWEGGFNWDKFGEFAFQEFTSHVPIFLTYGMGRIGLGTVMGMGYGEKMNEFYVKELENPGIHYSESHKHLISAGFSLAEGFDWVVSRSAISKGWRLKTSGRAAYIEAGYAGLYNHVKKTYKQHFGLAGLEALSEGGTTMLQNSLSGIPVFENVDHSIFTGGMFGLAFQIFPFFKGSAMATLTDSKTKKIYRNNLNDIDQIKKELSEKDLDPDVRKALEDQMKALEGDNADIIETQIEKFSNMEGTFTASLMDMITRTQRTKLEYEKLKRDNKIDPSLKRKQLKILEEQFANDMFVLELMKKDPAFGKKFAGFEKSTKREDIKRKKEIFKKAKEELEGEGKTDPSEDSIRERARLIYNTQEVLADYFAKKNNGDLSKYFQNYNTIDEAVAAIEKMETNDVFTEDKKKELIDEIKKGNHGATIFTKDKDGKIITMPFQVVESMAKYDRLETRTHEMGHDVLGKLFKENPKAFDEIADAILQYLQNHDIGSYAALRLRTGGYEADVKSEEVITNFMEMVAEKKINIKGGKNRTLPALLGHAFNNILTRQTKSKTGIDLQGENDAVSFIDKLAKKIKDGTISFEDIEAGKKSKVVKKYEDSKTEKSKGYVLSRNSALDAINDLLPNNIKTKKDYYRFIRNERQARDINNALILPGGVINNYIRSKQISKQEGDKVIEKTLERIFNFDPEATRQDGSKVGNEGFGEFLFSNTNFAKLDARKALFQEGQQREKEVRGDIVDDMGRTVFGTTEDGLSPEEMMILKQETPAQKRKTKETLSKVFGIDDKLTKKFEEALTTAFGTKLPEVSSKQMRTELGKIISDRLRPIIQKKIGTELKFDEFIKNDLAPLLKFLKAEDLRQLERMVGGKKFPNGRRIFTTSSRITKKQDIIDLQKQGLIPMSFTKYTQGYNLATRLPNPKSEELLAFFRGTKAETVLGYQPPGSIKSGMLGARKDKLAELLTREIAFDQAIKVAKEMLPKIKAIESLQNKNIKENYIAELGLTLDRDPDIGNVNTDNSPVKFSANAKAEVIAQTNRLVKLIKEYGLTHVIDKDGNFRLKGDNENISALAVDYALTISSKGVIQEGEVKRFKDAIQQSDYAPQWFKNLMKAQGALGKNLLIEVNGTEIQSLDQLHKDASIVAKELGKEVMDAMGYSFLGYYYGVMDPASAKEDKVATAISRASGGKVVYQKDEFGNTIKGSHNTRLNDLIASVPEVKLPKEVADILGDIRKMNKSFSLFGKIQKILDQDILAEDKLKQLAKLQPEVEAANKANIILGKHIAKTIINLARKGKISKLGAANIFQVQTSDVRGFRSLTRLDLIEVLDGSQAATTAHPDYKKALTYEKNKGKMKPSANLTIEEKVAKEKLASKGEHIDPNANTMGELLKLVFNDSNLDVELDFIFSNHTQLLASVHTTDRIDDGPGGKNSTAGFTRINYLDQSDINNLFSIDGRSFEEVLKERQLSKLDKQWARDANFKASKSLAMQKAKKNRNRYSKNPKVKGMSTFDFDDTLARTKSGVRYTMANTTGKSAPQKKVIFLAGSAGSGKSNVVKQLDLEGKGFKIVNQDISLEWLTKNSGLPTDMRDFTPEQASKWGELQWEARDIAQRKAMKFRGRGDGVVVDGTGASTISMFTQAQKYKDAGYDVQMLFVESSLETALARNKARKERSLKDFIVERNWNAVQKNKKAFKEEFGGNFAEVNTDKLKQGDPMPKSLVNKMNKFTDSYIKGRLTAEEFASKGGDLLDQGAKFDFSEFNKVVDGTPGPLLEKARNRAKKYGTKDMFVLTARPQQSAFAIQQFLKGQGLDIPIKNITGLANSSGDAKAQWMLDKFAEGYNDMYFVDDAIQNVEAVRQVLDQLDVKSKVVQAKVKFSKNASKEFNTIIEESQGTKADKIISQAAAKKLGRHKGWWRIFVPASAEDFKGLMYRFLGRGEQGNRHMAWFKDHLFDPFAKGIRSWNNYKQGMVNEYKALKKEFKDIKKTLNTKVKGTDFNSEQAVRVYLWDKAGFDIPGLDNDTKTKLINHVLDNTRLKMFADTLSKITRTEEGYIQPRQGWSIGNISMDLNEIVNKIGRKQFLQDWIENKNAIFTPDNMNKIEALYGTGFKDALENMLYRMEHGGNRRVSTDKNVNRLLSWINGSVGAIMFFNMRSALLQTISTVNFINMADNNIFKAGMAFANQKQFWNDFAMLFNSPMLKQRRAGIQIDVNASELTRAFKEGRGTPQGVISWLLEKGFTPTQVADSFAIAFGGASFYRNRYKKYIKEGMSPKEANEQAMLDFQEIAEETQQSSREDLISQQQASVLGRIVLAFQNVTMQMTRKTKKHLSDLTNRRRIPGYTQTQSDMANVGGIMYYGVAQNIIFLSLQSALAMYIWGDDEEEIDKKTGKVINGSLDSFLSGTGLHGAIAKTIKNTIGVYKEEKEKGWNREDANVLLELMSFSPPIGSKLRKIWNAMKTEKWNKGVSEELGWRIENPDLYYWASIIEAATNIPTQRLVKKMNNLEEAITGNHLMWQRIMMGLGWSGWTIGVKDEELEAAKEAVKQKKAEEKKKEKEEKKLEEKKEKEEEKKKEEEEKKAKGIKTVRCSGIRSNGERCGNTTETDKDTWLCYHHAEFKDGADRDGDGIKEYRCTAIKKNGERCKNKTENKSKKCYAHQ